jgi:serine phosphatase RsbU (regulator of sigma subunit)
VGFVLADIAGKGISGALLMANLQANLRSQYAVAHRGLSQLLSSVNRLFFRNTESSHYATMFFGLYEDATRSLRYANCGHNPPLLVRADGSVERLHSTVTVLGLFEQWDCVVAEVQLEPGDILAIYTDGITEAANHAEEEFGEERLLQVLQANRSLPVSELLQRVLASVQEFSPGEQADDLTLIIGRVR